MQPGTSLQQLQRPVDQGARAHLAEPKTQLSGSSLGIGLLAEFFWEELG